MRRGMSQPEGREAACGATIISRVAAMPSVMESGLDSEEPGLRGYIVSLQLISGRAPFAKLIKPFRKARAIYPLDAVLPESRGSPMAWHGY